MAVSSSNPIRKSRILIAGHDQSNVELLTAFLAELDSDIAIAIDGSEAIDKVSSFQPDLVILEATMPSLNGFEVCKRLTHDPATSAIMVLMLAALNDATDIDRAVDSGTDDFLSKPVDKVELLKRVENLLRLSRANRQRGG